jgi:hypothetical protein
VDRLRRWLLRTRLAGMLSRASPARSIGTSGRWEHALRLASIWRGGLCTRALLSIGRSIHAALMLQTRRVRQHLAPECSRAVIKSRGPIEPVDGLAV